MTVDLSATLYLTVCSSLKNTDDRRSDLVAAVTEGFAGHIGGQTVEEQISTGGTGGNGAVIGIKGHTGHLFFMVLGEGGTSVSVTVSEITFT